MALVAPSPRFTPLRIFIIAWLGLKLLTTICTFAAKMAAAASAAAKGPVQINITSGLSLTILGGLDAVLGCLNLILIIVVIYQLIKDRSALNLKTGCLIPLIAVVVWLIVKFALFVADRLISLTALKGSYGVEAIMGCGDSLAWIALLGVILLGLTRKP